MVNLTIICRSFLKDNNSSNAHYTKQSRHNHLKWSLGRCRRDELGDICTLLDQKKKKKQRQIRYSNHNLLFVQFLYCVHGSIPACITACHKSHFYNAWIQCQDRVHSPLPLHVYVPEVGDVSVNLMYGLNCKYCDILSPHHPLYFCRFMLL